VSSLSIYCHSRYSFSGPRTTVEYVDEAGDGIGHGHGYGNGNAIGDGVKVVALGG